MLVLGTITWKAENGDCPPAAAYIRTSLSCTLCFPTLHVSHPSPLPLPVHAQVRVYNLAKQALARKLVAGSGVITSMALHTSGDHLIVGSEDKRLW